MSKLELSPILRHELRDNAQRMEEEMGLSRRIFTREFKLAAVERLERGESVGKVARAVEVNASVLCRWRQEYRQSPARAFPGNGQEPSEPDHVAQLERKVGQQALEIDFLKGCLQRIEEQRQQQALRARPRFTGRSKSSEAES